MEAVERFLDLEAQVGEEEEDEVDDGDEMRTSSLSPINFVNKYYFDPSGDFIVNSHQEEEEVSESRSTFDDPSATEFYQMANEIANELHARATLERPSGILEGDGSSLDPRICIHPKLGIDLYNLVQASRDEDLWIFKVPVSHYSLTFIYPF
jgi:hypothetical protein